MNSKLNDVLIEKYKIMNEKPVFVQDYYSLTTKRFHKTRYGSSRFLNRMA